MASSSSVSRLWDDEGVQAVMFAVGLVVGSGLTVYMMRRNVERLEQYVELLRQEVRRLRIAVDDHLALYDGSTGAYNNNSHVLSYPASSPSDPPQAPRDPAHRQTAPLTPPPPPQFHEIHSRRQSPQRQTSPHPPYPPSPRRLSSSPRPPCSPPSPTSNSDGEEYLSARGRSENVQQSTDLDGRREDRRRGPTGSISPPPPPPPPSLPASSGRDPELAQMFRQVDQLMDGSDYDKRAAYTMLSGKSKQRQMTQNVNFLWRLAKATYFVSQLEGSNNNKMKQKNLVYKSKELAGKALQVDNNSADAHKWWAITLGSIGEYEGTTTKIQNGYQFKKHIEKAIELNPDDSASHHLLGRWCYRVYILPWMERKLAAALFATPPTATIDDALKHFLESERLNPGRWKENQLYIAKCYVEKKDYRKAVVWLEKAKRITVKDHSDEDCQQEVENLLTQYRGYRI